MYHTRSQVLLQVLWSFYIFFFSFNFDPSLKLLQILFLGYMFDGWDFFFSSPASFYWKAAAEPLDGSSVYAVD